jgi:hypothetical protein
MQIKNKSITGKQKDDSDDSDDSDSESEDEARKVAKPRIEEAALN